MLRSGERQVAPHLAGIRRDHVARYEFAADRLRGMGAASVLDAGCGIGYGARILAKAGLAVYAHDRNPEATAYGREHYGHPGIRWATADICVSPARLVDSAVAFEVLEHLTRPGLALILFPDRLLASVPNRVVLPDLTNFPHHVRHYTPEEFELLLGGAGYRVVEWWTQVDTASAPVRGDDGRTLVAVCAR